MRARTACIVTFIIAAMVAANLGAQTNTRTTAGAVQLGSGDNRAVELIVDGKPYFVLKTDGTLEGVNGGSITGAVGATADVSFLASNFYLTGGDKTWTVESGDVISHHYASIGKVRWYSLDLVTSDISASGTTGNVLNIVLPFTAKKRVAVPAVISNNNVWTSDARCLLPAASSVLGCVLNSAANFTAGTGTHGLRLQFWAEVP